MYSRSDSSCELTGSSEEQSDLDLTVCQGGFKNISADDESNCRLANCEFSV